MLHKQFYEHDARNALDFIWLELTNQCNLQCVHCYSESDQWSNSVDLLVKSDYLDIINSAAKLGCRKIQFIGGEPTLNKDLPHFIETARQIGYSFIEVYTNLTRLSDSLLQCFIECDVSVATSIYSHSAVVHDRITKRIGSHDRTLRNIDRLLNACVEVRAGMIVMEENKHDIEETLDFLRARGVEKCGTDRLRKFGRGGDNYSKNDSLLTELCGSSWSASVCVAPDGRVSPCIMSKDWSIGSVLEESFEVIVQSNNLKKIRSQIYEQVWLPIAAKNEDSTEDVNYNSENSCNPECRPNCVPSCNPACSPNCSPCFPSGKCNPQLFKP